MNQAPTLLSGLLLVGAQFIAPAFGLDKSSPYNKDLNLTIIFFDIPPLPQIDNEEGGLSPLVFFYDQ